MMQDLRRQSGDGEASQRPATAGSSYITPRAGEKMGADSVSGSQMPEPSWRKLEPQWGWGNHLSGAETNAGSWRCHLKQRGRRNILPFLLFAHALCSRTGTAYWPSQLGNVVPYRAKEGMDLRENQLVISTVGFLLC